MAKIKVAKATLEGLLSHIVTKRNNGGISASERQNALANADRDNPTMFAEHVAKTRVPLRASTRPMPADYDGSAAKWFSMADASGRPELGTENLRMAADLATKAYQAVVLATPGDNELDQILDAASIAKHKNFHDLHDGFTLAQIADRHFDPRASKHWARYRRLGGELVAKVAGERVSKIMTTTGTGTGLEFIPNTLSGTLIPLIRQSLVLGDAFQHISMPESPWLLPVEGTDVTPYLVSESTSDDPDTTSNVIGARTPATSNLTITAKKLGVTSFISAEATEDSLIDAAAFVRGKIAYTMAEGVDTAILNGDNLGSLDVDSAASSDYRRAWQGLRKLTASTAKYDISNAALTAQKLLNALRFFGKFAQRVEDTLIIVSPTGLVHLYGDTAFNRYDAVGGAQPPLVTGQVTKVFGRPLIVSGAVREDLNHAGAYDGSTTTRTIAVMAHRPSFAVFDRRNVTVKAAELIRSDRTMLVSTWRGFFGRIQAEVSSPVSRNVAQVININKSATF